MSLRTDWETEKNSYQAIPKKFFGLGLGKALDELQACVRKEYNNSDPNKDQALRQAVIDTGRKALEILGNYFYNLLRVAKTNIGTPLGDAAANMSTWMAEVFLPAVKGESPYLANFKVSLR